MGRICYAPCESGCVLATRRMNGGAVGIKGLEAAVGELALHDGWALGEPGAPTGKRVAVVGSGPCGLSASHQLVLAGHEVVLLEAHHALGGMLRRGISERRLPRWILDGEISRLVDGRMEVALSSPVRRIERAMEGRDGMIWAAGASRCMAVVERATIWRQPIHMDRADRRTATVSIGRGARAARALSDYLIGESRAADIAGGPRGSGPDSVGAGSVLPPNTRMMADVADVADVADEVGMAGRCILCGSRGALQHPR